MSSLNEFIPVNDEAKKLITDLAKLAFFGGRDMNKANIQQAQQKGITMKLRWQAIQIFVLDTEREVDVNAFVKIPRSWNNGFEDSAAVPVRTHREMLMPKKS